MPGWLASLLEVEVPLFLIVVLRIVVGAEFAAQGYEKINQGYVGKASLQVEGQAHPLEGMLRSWMEEEKVTYRTAKDGTRIRRAVGMLPWYQVFLERAVIPNVKTFALLVTVAEIALGVMLVLGLFVRVVSVFGILLILNFVFATWHIGSYLTLLNVLFAATLLVCAVAGAGRCLGLDAFLHERFPEIPLF